MAPPRASSVPSLSPAKGSKAGLYAVAATGLLLLVGGGGWYAMRGRKAPEPVVSVVSSAPPPAPSVVQPLAAVAEEPPKELPKDPPPETRKPISVPGPIASQPEPKRELPKAPEKPPEPTPAEKLATAVPLIATEPLRAAGLLKGITALQPADFQAQGNYLAALYRSRNAGEFERAYGIAKANGITVSSMLKVPAFKDAIQEERRLQKDKSPSKVLSEEMLLRIAQDIR